MSKENKNRVILVLSFVMFFNGAIAQQDSLNTGNEEDSIVYIYEPPVLINRTVTKKEEIFNHWFFELTGSVFTHSNAHRICTECSEFKSEIKKSIQPKMGHGTGANLMYMPPGKINLIYSFGISYASFHENFKHLNANAVLIKSQNKYNYLDLNLGFGYWAFRKRKISFIINGKLIGSRLMLNQGNTLGYSNFSTVLDVNTTNRDANYVLSGKVGVKVLLFNNKRIKFFMEPFTRFNMTSVLKYKANYYLDRWGKGVEVGLIYVL